METSPLEDIVCFILSGTGSAVGKVDKVDLVVACLLLLTQYGC